MAWDIQNFLSQLQQGFGPGQEKSAEQQKLLADEQKVKDMQLKDEMKVSEQEDKKRKADELFEFKKKKEQLSLIERIAKFFEPKQEKPVEGQPAPEPTPNPIIEALKKGIEGGFADYTQKSGFENPLATMSAQLAQGAVDNNLPDPYLPSTMSLMETGGGKNMSKDNNPFNYGGDRPDLNTAIDKINQGIGSTAGIGTTDGNGMGGKYRDYLNSGDMQDFFKVYTPSADPRNPNYNELMKRYTNLRGYFPQDEP